jgi:hypothetical protein
MSGPTVAGIVLATALSLAWSASARADRLDACIDAAEASQRLRLDGRLLKAKDKLLVCSSDACPAGIRADCGKWLSELVTAIPSVRLSVVDEKGADVPDARVSLDGEPIEGSPGGKDVPVDPGVHVFRFTWPGGPAVERTVVAQAGDQHHPLPVVLALPGTGEGTERPPPVSPTAPPRGSALAPIAFTAVGVGVVAVGFASYFWIVGADDRGQLESTCGPTHTCSPSSVDSTHAKLVAGDVLGMAGIGIAAAGVAMLLLDHHPAGPRFTAMFEPLRGGGLLGLGGRL